MLTRSTTTLVLCTALTALLNLIRSVTFLQMLCRSCSLETLAFEVHTILHIVSQTWT